VIVFFKHIKKNERLKSMIFLLGLIFLSAFKLIRGCLKVENRFIEVFKIFLGENKLSSFRNGKTWTRNYPCQIDDVSFAVLKIKLEQTTCLNFFFLKK